MWKIGEVKARRKEKSEETTVIIQMRHDGGWTRVLIVEVVRSD